MHFPLSESDRRRSTSKLSSHLHLAIAWCNFLTWYSSYHKSKCNIQAHFAFHIALTIFTPLNCIIYTICPSNFHKRRTCYYRPKRHIKKKSSYSSFKLTFLIMHAMISIYSLPLIYHLLQKKSQVWKEKTVRKTRGQFS